MILYKWFLATAIIIIVLLSFPHFATHAQVPESVSSPEDTVALYAVFYGVDIDLAKRIAFCESRFNPLARNPSSTASGLFQWLDGSFYYYAKKYNLPTANKDDPNIQIRLSMMVIRDGGLSNWYASRACWEK